YEFAALYSRGIGGTKYAFGNGGGAIAFVRPNGTLHSRNDAFNYDNYTGTIPEGTEPIRAAFSSWLRITKMYPESIKDNIHAVLMMGATNDDDDSSEIEFIPGDD